MNEVWKSYNENYKVSNIGRVAKWKHGKWVVVNYKDCRVELGRGIRGERKTILIVEMVAETFLSKRPKFAKVIFVDGNKKNWKSENLKWSHEDSDEKELWKVIDGYGGNYEVSNLGNVRKNSTYNNKNQTSKSMVLSQVPNGKGYLRVFFRYNKKSYTKYVHRLVAEYFIPADIERNEINHIDGNKANNNSKNLEWCTRLENVRHALDTGLSGFKLNHEKATEIIKKRNDGYSRKEIADEYGISVFQVTRVTRGNSWGRTPVTIK